jgi:hypothetical protein
MGLFFGGVGVAAFGDAIGLPGLIAFPLLFGLLGRFGIGRDRKALQKKDLNRNLVTASPSPSRHISKPVPAGSACQHSSALRECGGGAHGHGRAMSGALFDDRG